MAFNPLSGKSGSVMIGATAYAFSKWSASIKCNIVKANNFTGGGYQQVVAGLLSCSITLEALTYDQGNMAFTAGNSYTFILGYTTGINLTVTCLVEEIAPSVDVDGGEPIKISGQSNGSFTASIT